MKKNIGNLRTYHHLFLSNSVIFSLQPLMSLISKYPWSSLEGGPEGEAKQKKVISALRSSSLEETKRHIIAII